MLYKNIKI